MTNDNRSIILAVLLILALTFIFFRKILLTNLILVGVDTFLYFYPYKAYAAEALRQGRLPLWNPHLFMGAPFLANSQVGLFYPLNWPLLWLDAPRQVAWSIALHITLAGSLMFIFTRQALRLSGAGALTAAILFAFGGYLGAQVEHINQLNAAAWLPLLFLLYDSGRQRRRGKRWFWFLWLALVTALTLLAGHAQTVFISLFGLGLYALWQAVGEALLRVIPLLWRRAKALLSAPLRPRAPAPPLPRAPAPPLPPAPLLRLLLTHLWPLVVVSILAAALAAIQLSPTIELSNLSIRSGGLSVREAAAFSLPPATLHFTLLPPLGLDLTQVWGAAFGEWVAYLGVSGLVLALGGALVAIWRPAARRFVFIAAAGLILSVGLYSGPLYVALYYLGPGFDLFRVPARWLLLYAFAAAVLAGFGFEALLDPPRLRGYLATAWDRLRARRRRLLLFIFGPGLCLAGLIIWKTPPLITLLAWFSLLLIVAGSIYLVLRPPPAALPAKFIPLLFIPLLLTELLLAAQTLTYNQPTAPQAYYSLRNAIAFLLAADPPGDRLGPPPARFLSLSGVAYDPGDLAELERIYGDALSTEALYNLIVATKEKEVLFFNLPLLYGLHSVDGYDGGILPLARFISLQRLFLPADNLSLDGRLREKLQFVPAGRLLSLLNTRWIITDKVFDAWIDDIFYDLQFPARLPPGRRITTTNIPRFPATAIGLVSHLEGAAALPAGSPVAQVVVDLADGRREEFRLRAGFETAEGDYPAGAAHPQATIGVAWPYEAEGVDYVAVYDLTAARQITRISVEGLTPQGQFVLRGLSLIHRPTTTSRSVILSTEGDYQQVHSGDVKIYENLAVLPRAFITHQTEVVAAEAQAIALMQRPDFNPAQSFVRRREGEERLGTHTAGRPSPEDEAAVVAYEPERVEIRAVLETPGWLVLTDAYYPGWQATIDGRPAEISEANLMFRATAVPAGEHTIVFEYRPRSWLRGLMISGATLVLVGGGLLLTGVKRAGK